jgi:gamma-glutamylcyclotransferase (GGCT)/AIG2-like uncharacterized protein YtfP
MLYWCYGSNLNVGQMAWRCPKAKQISSAELRDYTLDFCRRGGAPGVATVYPCPGSVVPGGIWEITNDCLRALDAYEGYPRLYDRMTVEVHTPDGRKVEAMTYFMVNDPPHSPPSASYLRSIVGGYHDFGLDVKNLIRFVHGRR